MLENEFSYQVYGRDALFTDPATKIGGEKATYDVPTYEALVGLTESIYWKPTLSYVIDKVRIMNPIRLEAKSVRPLDYNQSDKPNLARYTYLRNVCYQVKGHFLFDLNRPDLAADRNTKKHASILRRSIERGGRRDIFLGTRECQGYVEPCEFGTGKSFYQDEIEERHFGVMVHGLNYPSQGKGQLEVRLWRPVMKHGIIDFITPEECTLVRSLRQIQTRKFSQDDIESVDQTYLDTFRDGGDLV